MARRSAVREGHQPAGVDGAGPSEHALGPADDPWEAVSGRRSRRGGGAARGGRWGGSGGRWWVWLGRALLWALIIVIVVNGVRAPFERFTAKSTPSGGGSGSSTHGFPTTAAEAFALQFTHVYLSYDPRNADARAQQLQAFVPQGASAQFGWNNVGQLQLTSAQVAGVDVRDADNAIVTVVAGAQGKWFRLAVPVYSKNGAMVVSARPALLPPPAKADLPATGVRDRDSALESELGSVMAAFFPAYAQSDQAALQRFSDGPPIRGLANSVTFVQVREIIAPRGEVDARTVTVTVGWQMPAPGGAGGGELDQTYDLDMVKKNGTWYVHDIRGTAQPNAS
ncbi:conjugal transfer protein [Spirillospora sp. NPDC052269]